MVSLLNGGDKITSSSESLATGGFGKTCPRCKDLPPVYSHLFRFLPPLSSSALFWHSTMFTTQSIAPANLFDNHPIAPLEAGYTEIQPASHGQKCAYKMNTDGDRPLPKEGLDEHWRQVYVDVSVSVAIVPYCTSFFSLLWIDLKYLWTDCNVFKLFSNKYF